MESNIGFLGSSSQRASTSNRLHSLVLFRTRVAPAKELQEALSKLFHHEEINYKVGGRVEDVEETREVVDDVGVVLELRVKVVGEDQYLTQEFKGVADSKDEDDAEEHTINGHFLSLHRCQLLSVLMKLLHLDAYIEVGIIVIVLRCFCLVH